MRAEYYQSMSEKLEDVEVGTTIYFTKTISETDVYMFSGVTGDFSPNHVDEEYMKHAIYSGQQ